jgi:hypothetical protein
MMTRKAKFQALDDQTLSPRHFGGLGLPSRQLHLWLKQLGWNDPRQKPRGWRAFSPSDVLRLEAFKALKESTDFSLSRHPDLTRFVASSESFVEDTLILFAQGELPLLVTDMAETHLRMLAPSSVDLAKRFRAGSSPSWLLPICAPRFVR